MNMRINDVKDLQAIAEQYNAEFAKYEHVVYVCGGGGCISCKCQATKDAVESYINELGLADKVKIVFTGCMGTCAMGPVVLIAPENAYYTYVTP